MKSQYNYAKILQKNKSYKNKIDNPSYNNNKRKIRILCKHLNNIQLLLKKELKRLEDLGKL